MSSSHVVLCWSTAFLYDHPQAMRQDLAWTSSPRVNYVSFPFPNNCTNNCHLLAQVLADSLVTHCNLVQLYNLVPDVL